MDDDATIINGQGPEANGDVGVLAAGAKLGDYRIVRLLGRGGMGEVYEGEHAWLAQRYALKVLPRELAQDPGFRRRFEMEARVLASLRHEHIVSVHNAGESGGSFFLVMDLLPGSLEAELRGCAPGQAVETLDKAAKVRPLPPARVREILLQILDALAFAHGKGIIHRDLKPANILLDANGSAKLADFGVARVVGDVFLRSLVERTIARSVVSDAATRVARSAGGSASGSSSTDAALVGTIDFMAPEMRGGRDADGRADVYAVGVIAYELLTGRRPLGMAKPPSRLIEGLDPAWDAVIERALEIELSDRWPDAASMRAAVERIGCELVAEARSRPVAGATKEKVAPAMSNAPKIGQPPPLPVVTTAPEPAAQIRPAVPPPAPKQRVWPWVVGGVAALLVFVGVSGGGLYWLAAKRAAALEEQARLEREWQEQMRLEEERRNRDADQQPSNDPDPSQNVDDTEIHVSAVPEPGSPWTCPDLELEMMWIPRGSFFMGSPDFEEGRDDDEGPQTYVEISSGFWLGAYEVTQAQWQKVMENNPSLFEGMGPNAPVENVSWGEAVEFCRRLTESERDAGRLPSGYVYTLPTEAQWEYACRAGTTDAFSWGDTFYIGWSNAENDADSDEDKSVETFRKWDYPVDSTMEVGRFAPNGWGLYDMHGNVSEWCLDWYSTSLPGEAVTDPTGPAEGSQRIARGGSWFLASRVCRSAYRGAVEPETISSGLGFRVALSPEP